MTLHVEHLNYHYGKHHVLKDVTFTLESGVAYSLVGRNGAGKSTLLRCLAGWAKPDKESQVLINDTSLIDNEREARKQLLFVSDTPDFYDELTAWEHLQFVAQLHSIPDWEATADDLLDDFGLYEEANGLPFTFSRGMRYKLALCLALMVNPSVLLLDEPFGPLDANAANILWETLDRARQAGMTILFSSHALPESATPDGYLLLNRGTVSQPDNIDDLADLLADDVDNETDETEGDVGDV